MKKITRRSNCFYLQVLEQLIQPQRGLLPSDTPQHVRCFVPTQGQIAMWDLGMQKPFYIKSNSPLHSSSTLDYSSHKKKQKTTQPSCAVIGVEQNQDQASLLRSFKQVLLVELLTFFLTFTNCQREEEQEFKSQRLLCSRSYSLLLFEKLLKITAPTVCHYFAIKLLYILMPVGRSYGKCQFCLVVLPVTC